MKVEIDFAAACRDFDWFAERLSLDGAQRRGERDVHFRCPAHDDYSPSLHVWEDEQGLGVHCFAGCTRADIEDALESEAPAPWRKLLPITRRDRGAVVARYDYRNAAGEVVYRKLRFEPKSFEFRRPVVVPARISGPVQHSEYISWRPGLKDACGNYLVQPIPYDLPDLLTTTKVWIVDGEKDADALAAEGVIATCSPYGMARWRAEWNAYLRDADVTIVADRDEPGYRAAEALAQSLRPTAGQVRVVESATGKDAHDHLAAGYDVGGFTLVCDA